MALSCRNDEGSRIPELYPCSNLKKLFAVRDSMPIISFNYANDPSDLIEHNPNIFNQRSCEKEIPFGLELPNKSIIKVTYFYTCDSSIIWCSPPQIEINLTKEGILRIGHKCIEIDSLQSIILDRKFDFNYYEIHFGWVKGTPIDRIQQVFTEIIDAQAAYAIRESRRTLMQDVCNVDSADFQRLSQYTSCDIYLEVGDSWILPEIDYSSINLD